MRILAVGDIHGDLRALERALDQFDPIALVCVGDWGEPNEVTESDLSRITHRVPTLTIFGNHDPLAWIGRIVGADGQQVLLEPGEIRHLAGLRIAGISGIWAGSHRQPYYVTDEDVADQAAQIAATGPVDLLLTHGCPIGLADQTPSGTRGGQRCFLLANQVIAPTIHLCGHLHRPQARTLKDGRQVLNTGATAEGSVVLLDTGEGPPTARLARIDGPSGDQSR